MKQHKSNLVASGKPLAIACPVLLAVVALIGAGWSMGTVPPVPLSTVGISPQAVSQADPRSDYSDYTGAEACKACHLTEYNEWATSRHSRMVQPIKPSEVKASFTPGASLSYRGRRFTFERDGTQYFIVEHSPGLPTARHAIDYTLGNRRIQHFMTRKTDGSLVLLPPSWDVLRGEWFPQEDIVPTGDSGVEPVQVWNKNCFGCHVSQERKNFDTETLTYESDWLDSGTNCETCHGAGRPHVEYFEMLALGEEPSPIVSWQPLKRPLMPFAGEAATDLCATCHQNRYLLQADHTPGDPFYDYFLTALPYTVPPDSPDPGYYVDGRTRRFSNNSFGIWLSSCYLKGGVRCIDCHRNGHSINIEKNPQLASPMAGEQLCSRCHSDIVEKAEEHSRHPLGSEGNSCVACHMPRTVSGIKATMRDHSLAVPVPENTVDYGIPNACNLCHEERSPQWAADNIQAWFGNLEDRPDAMKLRQRAAAFSAAQYGEPAGLDPLLEIVRNVDEPFLMRATAAGYLRAYPGPRALDGLRDALADPHPLVRAIVPLSIVAHPQGRTLLNDLVSQLSDPSYSVRINTAFAFTSLGIGRAEGTLGEHLRNAQDEYIEHLQLYTDSDADQSNRGTVLALRGEFEEAIRAYQIALRLNPEHADARFGLGVALLQTGARAEAVREFEKLLDQNPDYPGLKAVLAQLGSGDNR